MIKEKTKTLNTPFDLPTNYKETTKQLKETRKEARQLARDIRSYNTTIQQEREKAFIKAHEETMSKRRATERFRTGEEVIKLMKSLPKSGRKKKAGGPLSCILVPLPKEGTEIEWYAITDGPTIEKVILGRNKRHFSQAGETPLVMDEIIELFGPGRDT